MRRRRGGQRREMKRRWKSDKREVKEERLEGDLVEWCDRMVKSSRKYLGCRVYVRQLYTV